MVKKDDKRRVKKTGFFETRDQLESEILRLNKLGNTNREISKLVGVSKETVHGIITGRDPKSPEDKFRNTTAAARNKLKELGW